MSSCSSDPARPAVNADTTLAAARAADAASADVSRRGQFMLPDGLVYLDGNSLGALPRATPQRLAIAIEREWGQDLITSWNLHGWIEAPQRLGTAIGRLIGAAEGEVIVADTTSINIFKLLAAACEARPDRAVILSEPGNFPTDLYVADGVARMLPGRTVRTATADTIVDAIDEDVAVVLLTHVHYKTGRKLDMAAITAAAHAKGALVLWDLSHSVGAVAVDLDTCDADLAVGCGYKYLNGGPGAPAFLYVAHRLQSSLRSPLTGWMGHAEPFAFVDEYRPAGGIARFLCGTPPIIGMAALEEGLSVFAGIDLAALFAQSQALCDRFIACVEARGLDGELRLLTSRDPALRGSHVSYAHADAYAVCQALIARGVVGDFRAPDAVRFGFTPLYTSHEDVWRAVDILADVLATRAWDRPEFRIRAAVT